VELYLCSLYAYMAWMGTTFTFTDNINDGYVELYVAYVYDICHKESGLCKSCLEVQSFILLSVCEAELIWLDKLDEDLSTWNSL
jgi:hypothetical protein